MAGCSKDKETQPILAGSFQAESVINTAPIMMYTNAGLVDNQALVDKFLARHTKGLDGYFSRVDVPIPTAYSFILAFRGNSQVTLLSKGAMSTDSVLTEITSQSSQRLVLAEKDSITIFRGTPSDRAEELSSLMQGEQPGQRCSNPPPSMPYIHSQYCRVRPIRVITSHDGKLFLPQLSWLIQTSTTYRTSSWAYSKVQNTFNTAVLNQLVAGDTLIVQAREVPFSKK